MIIDAVVWGGWNESNYWQLRDQPVVMMLRTASLRSCVDLLAQHARFDKVLCVAETYGNAVPNGYMYTHIQYIYVICEESWS